MTSLLPADGGRRSLRLSLGDIPRIGLVPETPWTRRRRPRDQARLAVAAAAFTLGVAAAPAAARTAISTVTNTPNAATQTATSTTTSRATQAFPQSPAAGIVRMKNDPT